MSSNENLYQFLRGATVSLVKIGIVLGLILIILKLVFA